MLELVFLTLFEDSKELSPSFLLDDELDEVEDAYATDYYRACYNGDDSACRKSVVIVGGIFGAGLVSVGFSVI